MVCLMLEKGTRRVGDKVRNFFMLSLVLFGNLKQRFSFFLFTNERDQQANMK